MKRGLIVIGAATALLGCRDGRENALARAKLGDVRALAEQVESSCNSFDPHASPARGSAVSRDPDVIEVRVECLPKSAPLPMIFPPLRAPRYPDGKTSAIVPVGQSEGMKKTADLPQEWAQRPSALVTSGGLDLCVRRAGDVRVCVAYREQ